MEGRDVARDRISELPDDLLSTHILSLLPTEEAVRRWLKVWVSLPVLVFDDHKTPVKNLTEEEFRKREAKFLIFLGGVLFHRENLPLDKFELIWWGKERNTHLLVFEFLCCAVMCRPRVLSIDIETCIFFDVPDSIFTCTSIEEMSLRLNTTYCLDEDKSITARSMNLPFLRKLQLGEQELNDDIMRMLMSGCPVLEELVLLHCWLEMSKISSNMLKKLVIDYCYHDVPMEISCPGVVSLSIGSMDTGSITLKNMSSLAMADIYFEYVDLSDSSNHDLRLLGGLSNVTSLKLDTSCPDVMDLLQEDIPNCPILKNLKSLDIGEMDINLDWNLVDCFLQHSSNLKDLTLYFYQLSEDAAKEEFQRDMSFQREYLDAVKIRYPGKNVKLSKEQVSKDVEYVRTTAKIIIFHASKIHRENGQKVPTNAGGRESDQRQTGASVEIL